MELLLYLAEFQATPLHNENTLDDDPLEVDRMMQSEAKKSSANYSTDAHVSPESKRKIPPRHKRDESHDVPELDPPDKDPHP